MSRVGGNMRQRMSVLAAAGAPAVSFREALDDRGGTGNATGHRGSMMSDDGDFAAGHGVANAAAGFGSSNTLPPGAASGGPNGSSFYTASSFSNMFDADEEGEEYQEIEMVDACMQVNTDAGSDDKLHEACSDFFREVDRAAALSQTICKNFYGSGDFLNPSSCCVHALQLLAEVTKRAMQLKERRIASERADQMLKGGSGSSSAAGGVMPKPKIEGLLSMTKTEHVKLLSDGATTAKELRLRLEALDSSENFRRAVQYKAPKSAAEPCSFCTRVGPDKEALLAKDLLVVERDKTDRLEREKQALVNQVDKIQKRLEHEKVISQHRAEEMEKVLNRKRKVAHVEVQTADVVFAAPKQASPPPLPSMGSALQSPTSSMTPGNGIFGPAPPLVADSSRDTSPVPAAGASRAAAARPTRRGSTEVTFDKTHALSPSNSGLALPGGRQVFVSISPNPSPGMGGGGGGGGTTNNSSRRSSRSTSGDTTTVGKSSGGHSAGDTSTGAIESATFFLTSIPIPLSQPPTKGQLFQMQLVAFLRDGWSNGVLPSSPSSPTTAAHAAAMISAGKSSAVPQQLLPFLPGPRSLTWCLGLIHAAQQYGAQALYHLAGCDAAAATAQLLSLSEPPPDHDADPEQQQQQQPKHNRSQSSHVPPPINIATEPSDEPSASELQRLQQQQQQPFQTCSQLFVDYMKQALVSEAQINETAASFLGSLAVYSHDPRIHLYCRFFLNELGPAAYREYLVFSEVLERASAHSATSPNLDVSASPNIVPLHVVLVQVFTFFGRSDKYASAMDVSRELAVAAVGKSFVVNLASSSSSSISSPLGGAGSSGGAGAGGNDLSGSGREDDGRHTKKLTSAELPHVARSQFSVSLPVDWLARYVPLAAYLEELAVVVDRRLRGGPAEGHPVLGDFPAAMSNVATPMAHALGYQVQAIGVSSGGTKGLPLDGKKKKGSDGGALDRPPHHHHGPLAANAGNGGVPSSPQAKKPRRPSNSASSATDRTRRQTIR